jgi:hypothetical protein
LYPAAYPVLELIKYIDHIALSTRTIDQLVPPLVVFNIPPKLALGKYVTAIKPVFISVKNTSGNTKPAESL